MAKKNIGGVPEKDRDMTSKRRGRQKGQMPVEGLLHLVGRPIFSWGACSTTGTEVLTGEALPGAVEQKSYFQISWCPACQATQALVTYIMPWGTCLSRSKDCITLASAEQAI